MPNLSAAEWAASALAHLKIVEQNCAEQDLFCVGYLIPQVELVEVQYTNEADDRALWQERFVEFVRANMALDKMQSDDIDCIEGLMAEL